jgi:hypothetical protein
MCNAMTGMAIAHKSTIGNRSGPCSTGWFIGKGLFGPWLEPGLDVNIGDARRSLLRTWRGPLSALF